jgi:putative Mg2+ transporter-C (MgtC) family protein
MEWIDALLHEKLEAVGWPLEALVRLLLAALAGGLVGLEREIRGRHAGFRTNLLVCLGSALVMIVSNRVALTPWPVEAKYLQVDPARIAYGVMTGIGFLGAGVIIQSRTGIRGLTTAAALWCVAAVGLSAGLGLYSLTVSATGIVVLSLWLLDYVGNMLPKTIYREVTVRRKWERGCVRGTIDRLQTEGLDVQNVNFHRTADLVHVDIDMTMAFSSKRELNELEKKLTDDSSYELLAMRQL